VFTMSSPERDVKPNIAEFEQGASQEADAPATPIARPEKLNLTLSYGTQQLRFALKPSAKLEKMFNHTATRFNVPISTFRFLFNGKRLKPSDTPQDHHMEDGDEIEAMVEQHGGRCY